MKASLRQCWGVELDGTEYQRWAPGAWEELMGSSWEPLYGAKEDMLEARFQLMVRLQGVDLERYQGDLTDEHDSG